MVNDFNCEITGCEHDELEKLLQPFIEKELALLSSGLRGPDRYGKIIELCETYINQISNGVSPEATDRDCQRAIVYLRGRMSDRLKQSGNLLAAREQLRLASEALRGLSDVASEWNSIHFKLGYIEQQEYRDTGNVDHFNEALRYFYLTLEHTHTRHGGLNRLMLSLSLNAIAALLGQRQETYSQALTTYEILGGMEPYNIPIKVARANLLMKLDRSEQLTQEAAWNNMDTLQHLAFAIAANIALGDRSNARSAAQVALKIAKDAGDVKWSDGMSEFIRSISKGSANHLPGGIRGKKRSKPLIIGNRV